MAQDELLNTKQAADLLGFTTQYVRELCQDGRLDCFKLGREWIITRGAVEEYKQKPRDPRGRPPKSTADS